MPTTSAASCQSQLRALPAGWTLAAVPNDKVTAAIQSFKWGAQCLITANGNGYTTLTGKACGTNQLTTSNGQYRPLSCSSRQYRILITQPGQRTRGVRDDPMTSLASGSAKREGKGGNETDTVL